MSHALLKTGEAATHIGLAATTLEKMRVYGGGPKYLKLGRAVRYRIEHLEEWMGERLTESTSEKLDGRERLTRGRRDIARVEWHGPTKAGHNNDDENNQTRGKDNRGGRVVTEGPYNAQDYV